MDQRSGENFGDTYCLLFRHYMDIEKSCHAYQHVRKNVLTKQINYNKTIYLSNYTVCFKLSEQRISTTEITKNFNKERFQVLYVGRRK